MRREELYVPEQEGSAKSQFHAKYRRVLRAFAKRLDLPPGSYEVRSCLGGPAVLGEVILHADALYLWVGGSVCTPETAECYYRSCEGRKDFVGGLNRFMPLAFLENEEGIIRARAAMAASGKEPRYGRA